MPESKAVGRDFSKCRFRTLLTNLPPGVQHMIERALDSFGTDVVVLDRWTGPVVERAKDGTESTVAENRFFPHDKSIKDICCADGVAFCLYQTGVVDFGRDKDYFKSRKMNGDSMKDCIHWAHYYYPHTGNVDVVYELPKIDNKADASTIDFRDWLPGDVFVYFDDKGDPEGDHVNIYLGPFIEVVDGVDKPEPVYHMFNSSIGMDGGNAFCTPGPFKNHLQYCKSVGRTMVRARVRAIEKLFRNMIAPPVVFADARPKPNDPPQIDLAWKLARGSDSPYPVGRNLTWHEGIHLPAGDGLKNHDVECFAPGELVLARFGKATRAGDSSMVLARHRFVTAQTRLLPPPPWKEGDKDDPAAAESKHLYSLYMQLAPLDTYLETARMIDEGIPALYDGSSEPPAGKAVAPEWLRNLWPRPTPDPIDVVPDTAQLTLLALTRSGPDAQPALASIGAPKGLTTPVWHPLKDLESVTVGSAKYWLVPVSGPTNAEVWDMKIPPATVPRRKKLTYYNPATNNTLDLPLNLSGATALSHQEENGQARLVRVLNQDQTPVTGAAGTLIRIEAHHGPGVILSSFHDVEGDKDQFDYDDHTGILLFKPAAKNIPLYTTTEGQGDKRTFDDGARADLGKIAGSDRTFLVTERKDTGGRRPLNRAFLDLKPGVWMTDDEIAQAEKLLDDKDTSLREAIKKRLETKRSCLVGARTDPKSGWEMKEGHLHASDDPPESGTLLVYRRIKGAGLQRDFEKPPPETELADQEQSVVFAIAPPSPDTAIYPLLTPQGRVQSAVFELMFGATETGTNQAAIDAIIADNQKRMGTARKLLAGELVDLRTTEGVSQFLRNIGRDRLGRLGQIPAPLGASGTVPGLHFELFSGENLVDPAVSGSDGAIAPVPKTKWLVCKDSTAEGFFSPAFVKKLVDLLQLESDAHRIDLSGLASAFGEDGVVQPKEWIEFCKANHRALARLVTVHKPEWKIDWAAEIKSTGTRAMHTADPEKEALAEDTRELRWWKDDLSLDGVEGDTVFFYHPLRFIEWLNTGIDFIVTGREGKKPGIKIEPLEGGTPVELSPDAREPALFRFRAFVGEGENKTESRFRVTLENIVTATSKFTVLVKRGQKQTIRLLQPGVEPAAEYPHAPVAPDFQTPVTLGGSGNGFFLADGNVHLANAGYSETTIAFKVSYNVRIPNEVEVKIEGDNSFRLGPREVSGATVVSPPPPSPRSLKLKLADDAQPAAFPEDSVVEGARIYSLRVNVTTATTTFGATAKLIATFKGGDLGDAETKREFSLATRVIAKPKGNLNGEDVAKLQLYLSQIYAADDLPCYRDAGKGGEYRKDPKTMEAKIKPAKIDGIYGKSLARALWRFIYRFGHDPKSNWAARSIETRKENGDDGAKATRTEIMDASASVIEGLIPTKSIPPAGSPDDLYAQRVGAFGKRYDHYPVVDKPLLDEIVKHFKLPLLLPHIEVFFEETIITAPTEVLVDADWNKAGRIGKSAVLPLSGDHFPIRIQWHGADEVRDGDLDIVIEVSDKSGYSFNLGPGSKTVLEGNLRALLKQGTFLLYSNGTLSSKAADNLLVVRTKDGRKIGERQLHGSRDLLKVPPGDACRDAAMLQLWLSRIADKVKAGESVYKNTRSVGKGKEAKPHLVIDGKWNGKCVEALKRFQAQYAPAATTFPALAAALRDKALPLVQYQGSARVQPNPANPDAHKQCHQHKKNRLLAISTALGDDKLLIKEFSLSDQLGRMFQIEVELMSADTAVDFDQMVGSNASIRLELPKGETRYFNGFVCRFVQGESEGSYARYRATLVPWLWFLTRTADCRIFQKKKVPDIIEEVFKAHGFKDYKLKLSGTHREWEYCVQYRETDFNFVSRLMEQEGIYYYFEHANGVHTLILADGDSAHSPFAGYEEMIYRPQTGQVEELDETVSDWVMEKEVQSGAYALADFNFQTTVAPILTNASVSRSHPASSFEIFDYPGEFKDVGEGDACAKVRIEELQAQHEILRAQTTVRGACVGSKFKLKDHPRADQNNRDYLITGVTCHASVSDYESGSAPGQFFSCNFTAMPAKEPFRAARLTPKPVIQGPQTAIVVGKKGEEIDTDEFGRVRVQFHWDRYGKVDENSSCWVRVSQAAAGKSWGAISLPRIGQEVIVEFLEGDPDHPIITGRVYNAKATVPYELPANKTMSAFKSNSSKGGAGFNEIRFEDKKGEEQVFIHGEKNQDIRIKNDAFEWIGNNRHLIIKKDQLESVENNRHEKVTNDHCEEIGKDRHLKVKGKEAKEVTGSHSFKVTGAVIEEFKDNHSEMVTKDYYLKGDNIVIEGLTNVTIKVGGTSIAMAADGIALKTDGTIKIECSATMDLKSDAPLTAQSSAITTIKGSMVMIN